MTRTKAMARGHLINKLKRVFPELGLVMEGEENGWAEGAILVGAEDNSLLDYWGSLDGLFGKSDSKLDKVIEDAGWWLEWNDPGTVLLFKAI